MPWIINRELIGTKFGRLTVVSDKGRHWHGSRRRYWECICLCGKVKIVSETQLVNGYTKSCGCLQREAASRIRKKHGQSKTSEFSIWACMIDRCYRIKNKRWDIYGGRGITVCDKWKQSFSEFLADMGNRPSRNHSLDRIDTNGNYEPSNCRWATLLEQANNTRTNLFITHDGKTLSLSDWQRILKFNYSTVRSRIQRGISFELAIK